MYKIPTLKNTFIKQNESLEGETIENKIERIINNKEPIKDGAPLIYTERQEGIRASTNIRTDRFEIAIDATDKIQKSYQARRDNGGKIVQMDSKKDGEPESTQGKTSTDN